MSALKEKIGIAFAQPVEKESERESIKKARTLISMFAHSPGYYSESVGNFGTIGTNAEGERYCGSLGVHHIRIGG